MLENHESQPIYYRDRKIISEPLTHIINLSIRSGIVPDRMKIARVIPIFKSGDSSLLTNYRPVSVLPVFSKLLEKVVYNRILKYLDKHGILFKNQYGFRKGHSTSFALLHLFEKISSAIDRREHTVGVFLDLSKAFDTVNFDILFDKLEHYGIRGIALNWIKDYFSGRSQFVQFNEQCSNYYSIKCGVPRARSSDRYSFYCSLMTFPMFLISSILFYLLMIQIYFSPIETKLIWSKQSTVK